MLRPHGTGDVPGALFRNQGPVRIQSKDPAVMRRKQGLQRGLRQEHRNTRVLQHERQPLPGILRVQRHIGPPRFENSQQTHQHFQRAIHTDAHQSVRPHPQPLQMTGQLVGALIEMAIRQLFVFKDDGWRFRRAPDLLLNQFMQAPILVIRNPRLVPLHQYLVAFVPRQQRQIANASIGIRQHTFQHRAEMSGHAVYAGVVEQIGAVFHFQPDVIHGVGHENLQIEL